MWEASNKGCSAFNLQDHKDQQKHTSCHKRFCICFCPAFVVLNQYHHFDGCRTWICLTLSLLLPVTNFVSSAVYISFDNERPSLRYTSHISFDSDSKDSINLATCLSGSSVADMFLSGNIWGLNCMSTEKAVDVDSVLDKPSRVLEAFENISPKYFSRSPLK